MKIKQIIQVVAVVTILFVLAMCVRAQEAKKEFYRANEFSVDGFYQTVTPDFEQERGLAGAGFNFFPWRQFGIGVSTAIPNLDGPFIDSVSLRGIYRVPIERTAIYGYGGSTRLLKAEEWTIDLGGGVEHRFTPNFGPFGEIGMIKLLKHSAEATARIGVRLSF